MIDYGAGNLASVIKGFEAVSAQVHVATSPDRIRGAEAIVVPGVGNFGAKQSLDQAWRDAILEATAAGAPLLGICLGMQWLFKGSDEAPELTGLGIFPGRCAKIPDGVKVPHVGWNTLEITNPRSRLLADVAPGAYAYFTHSFAAPVVEGVVAAATYGGRFAAAAERRRVYGVQFHPEKSGRTGLQILENFVRLARDAH
jgi:glutamine amidotransferase